MDMTEFNELVEKLPERFGNLNVGYHNGPRLMKRNARRVMPNPTKFDSTSDNTDLMRVSRRGKIRITVANLAGITSTTKQSSTQVEKLGS